MPSFMYPQGKGGTFFPPSTVPLSVTATSGTTIQLPMGVTSYFITNTATLAALTLMMPPNPYQGKIVSIYPGGAITSLTLRSATGNMLAGSPLAAIANTPITYIYLGPAWEPSLTPAAGTP